MTVRDGLVDPAKPLRPGPTLATVMQRIAQTPVAAPAPAPAN